MRIAITGTPGTGKTNLSRALGRQLKCPVLNVNALIQKRKLGYKKKGEEETTVYLRQLHKELKKWFAAHADGIVESHLLCEVTLPADVIVVLRCRPDVLEKRLRKRGYSKAKILENVLAEALDYCLQKTEKHYQKSRIIQIDATRRVGPKTLADKLVRNKTDAIDWSAWLRKNAGKFETQV